MVGRRGKWVEEVRKGEGKGGRRAAKMGERRGKEGWRWGLYKKPIAPPVPLC